MEGKILCDEFPRIFKIAKVQKATVVINHKEDVWGRLNYSGEAFAVKEVRKEIVEAYSSAYVGIKTYMWNNLVPIKANVLVWRAKMGRISTADALQVWRIQINAACKLCGFDLESANHLLVTCMIAKAIWWQIWVWIKVPIPQQLLSVEAVFEYIDTMKIEKGKKKLLNVIGHMVCWSIWIARNDMVFNKKNISWQKIIEDIKETSFLWIKSRSKSSTLEWEEWYSGRIF
ncbi:hypothetical protein E3N88_29531 [Mikania micrantha]|uniref:Reverse transcriptase zinc-binding domain-containing protein n=1 Tax=Mikania micrantha TaxID=192012 RepID=A0A5N6MJN5_9ASTR|nr:hypothetical protein E3N88_29531 [Mikania micrantha]